MLLYKLQLRKNKYSLHQAFHWFVLHYVKPVDWNMAISTKIVSTTASLLLLFLYQLKLCAQPIGSPFAL